MKIKRTGTMMCLICNILTLITIIGFIPICKIINVGFFINEEVIIDNIIIGANNTIIVILAILFIKDKIKKEYIGLYSISMLILSIVVLGIMLVVFSSNLVCCYVIYLIFPVISLIGSIMILVGNGKKDEIKTGN